MKLAASDGRGDRWARVALFVTAVLGCAAIFRHPDWLASSYDWRYFQTSIEAARRSIVWFHELPLYNPYMCGGEPQLANPQSIAGSPAFALVALFGTALGVKLMLLAFFAVGLDGTFRLSRRLGIDRVGAGCAAIVFGLSGWVVLHFGIGHVSFFGATLLPHALYFYLRAQDDRRWAVALGAVMALVVAQGGTSTAAMAAIALATVAGVDAIAERSATPLVVLALGAAAALSLGAYRLLPALEFAIDHPRHVTESDAQTPLELLRGAFVWSGAGKLPGHRYGVHEYSWRLSYLAWPLIALGAWASGALVRRRAVALFLVGALIAVGDFVPFGPWWGMRHLPVLRDLRVPSRYVLLCALALSLLAGVGAARLASRARLIGLALVALLAVEGVVYSNARLAHVFDQPAPSVAPGIAFHQVRGHWSRMLELVYASHGVIGCDEEAPLTRALALDEGPVPQLRLDDPDAGRVQLRTLSPDRIEAEVELDRPAELLINLNWNEHWKTSVGEIVRHGAKWPADQDGGRLAVRLPVLRGPVTLRYRPTSFVVGSAITFGSLLGLFALFWWRGPRRLGRGREQGQGDLG